MTNGRNQAKTSYKHKAEENTEWDQGLTNLNTLIVNFQIYSGCKPSHDAAVCKQSSQV